MVPGHGSLPCRDHVAGKIDQRGARSPRLSAAEVEVGVAREGIGVPGRRGRQHLAQVHRQTAGQPRRRRPGPR